MDNGRLARLKYYRGQLLTARDFDDQQEYHRDKQKLLLRRFPPGIIGGLVVTFEKKDENEAGDVDSFKIGEGLAVDLEGNELSVPKEGIKEPVSKFNSDAPYLSLVYDEGDEFVGGDPCGEVQKNNRVRESVRVVWDPEPNMPAQNPRETSHVTVAFIQESDDPAEKATFGGFRDPMKPKIEDGDPPVRKNARVVDTEQISDLAVTTDKLANEAVTKFKLADNAVTTEKILNSAVIEDKLAGDAVTNVKIKDGAVTADKLDDNAVITGKILDKNVTEEKLNDEAVTTVKIKDEAVNTDKLAPGAIVGDRIPDGSIAEAKLVLETITHASLADNAVTNVKINDNAVNANKLDDNAVVTAKILDKNVTRAKLADDALVATALADNIVSETKLTDNAVTNVKIRDDAVTTGKILDKNVTRAKLADDALVATALAASVVAETNIEDGAVTRGKLNLIRQIHPDPSVPNAEEGSIIGPGLPPVDVPPLNVSPNSIVHVVPVNDGVLSWTFTVRGGGPDGTLVYSIRVVNPAPEGGTEVAFVVREIQFN